MRLLLILSLLAWSGSTRADGLRLLLQSLPLAGSQYYAFAEFWPQMRVGDHLELIREPDNRYDANAIRVEWRGHKIGYVPRRENRVIAGALAAGERLSARLSAVGDNKNPWQRLAFEVFVEL